MRILFDSYIFVVAVARLRFLASPSIEIENNNGLRRQSAAHSK